MTDPFVIASQHVKDGKPQKAVDLLLPLLRKAPAHAPLRYMLGVALAKTGDHRTAIFHLSEGARLDSRNTSILLVLARSLAAAGESAKARSTLERIIELEPSHTSAYVDLSNLCLTTDDLDGARDALTRAVAAHPHLTDTWKALSALELSVGNAPRSAEILREAMARMPDRPELDTYLCATLNYMPGVTPEEVFKAHQEFGLKTMAHIRTTPPPFDLDFTPARPLRIGWLSPDLRRHSVAYFLEPLLAGLDRSSFSHVLFSTWSKRDEVTERLAGYGELIMCRDVEFRELPTLIRSKKIDILIELSGHTADHRLWSLARKPAPVIATYLGYPNTTGLPTIDYRIVDEITDPPGAEALATETLVRLPAPFLCYSPPAGIDEPAPPPCVTRGHVTFGSFNSIQKLNEPLARMWAQAAAPIEGAKLVIKCDFRQTATRERVLGWLKDGGLDPARVELRTHADDYRGHLSQYADVDIALDTFPYHGTTTTCEAMLMGVPVLTMPGPAHASRVGCSLLHSVGHPELICADAAALATRARELAGDPERLVMLRRTLRNDLLGSSLCDRSRLASSFGAALRRMWADRCAKDVPQS